MYVLNNSLNLYRQHLQRVHRAPKFYCYSCCRSDFENQISVMAHIRVRPACEPREPPLYLEKISQELADTLKIERKNECGIDRVEYWWNIFDTLFPGARMTRGIDPCTSITMRQDPPANSYHSLYRSVPSNIELILLVCSV